MTYNLEVFANDNFIIHEGLLCLNTPSKPPLQDIVKSLEKKGHKGPLILRFPHILQKQIDALYKAFKDARDESSYKGSFNAVFPLKVNQNKDLVSMLLQAGKAHGYGLEAGSKAELLLALIYADKNSPITVNGFKDEKLLDLGFMAAALGHDITLIIEGINELNLIIKLANKSKGKLPKIGIRARLHSSGHGQWAKSAGMGSKFGLSSTELIESLHLLKKNNLLDQFVMLHFHLGSQITEIYPIKKALRELGNIYAQLRLMGAHNLRALNLGGGLGVEYSQFKSKLNYTLSEYANDIVFILKNIFPKDGQMGKEPDIFIESGRFITASHAVLIAPVLELFSRDFAPSKLSLGPKNPELIEELLYLYENLNQAKALEYLNDSNDHLNSILTLFDLGYVSLQDRANAEILAHLIAKKASTFLYKKNELKRLFKEVQERYLLNFSLFASLPDSWGLGQNFPFMPLSKLDEKAKNCANLLDITCDSDGEIAFSKKKPIFLHDVDLESEDYYIAFFQVGAYQEILGMQHNLFSSPTKACVEVDDEGFKITSVLRARKIKQSLKDMGYNPDEFKEILSKKLANLHEDEAARLEAGILGFLDDDGYLGSLV